MRRERERKATGVAQIRRANGRNRSRTSLFAEADDPNPRVITTPRSKRVDTRGSIRGPPVDRERPFAPSSRSRRVGIDGPEPASAANDAQIAPDRRSPNAGKKQLPRLAVRDTPLDADARSSHLSTPERFRVKGVDRTRPGLRAMCRWALPAGLAADDGRLHATFTLPPALQTFPPLNLEPRIRSPRPDNQRPTASLGSALIHSFLDGPGGKARTVDLGLTRPIRVLFRPNRSVDHHRRPDAPRSIAGETVHTKATRESHRAVSGAWRPRWRRRLGWRERGSTPARR
jgi:hypothetical protein